MSIQQILESAWRQIEKEHGVSVSDVQFDTMRLVGGDNVLINISVEFDAKPSGVEAK